MAKGEGVVRQMKTPSKWESLPAKRQQNILDWATIRYDEWRLYGLTEVANDLASAIAHLRSASKKKARRR